LPLPSGLIAVRWIAIGTSVAMLRTWATKQGSRSDPKGHAG
jgi:hypothetical protein